MKRLRFVVKLLIRIIAAARLINFKLLRNNYDKNSDVVVWIYPYHFKHFMRTLPMDIILLAAVVNKGLTYKIYFGNRIGKFHNHKIFYNLSARLNFFSLDNYVSTLLDMVLGMEGQGNQLFPPYKDVRYWENKVYMYEQFAKLNIPEPNSRFYSDFEELVATETNYPFILKLPHSSGSKGVFYVKGAEVMDGLLKGGKVGKLHEFIVQDKVDISMDLRVILVGDEIVHFYWRRNAKDLKEWTTTSTSNGSTVDFLNFPEESKQEIINAFQKMNIYTGAFDIGWDKDDLNGKPYFFEISPSYDLNPIVNGEMTVNNYGESKEKIVLKGGWDKAYVDFTYQIKLKYLNLIIEMNNLK
jgi:glutathione synthase/RimK-type ligase-like ATP-grasp enzyme